MSAAQYEARLKTAPAVLIPTGACEIYGPHLPMGTDFLVAVRIAELVARRTGALIAPTLEVGESSALAAFSSTFALPRRILEDYLSFLVEKLVKDGARNLLFLTGHGGNVDTAAYVAKECLARHRVRLAQVDWWRFAATNSGDLFAGRGQMAHGHAGECGTSVMLYLFPELVDTQALPRVEPPPREGFDDVLVYQPMTWRTPNGAVGDAQAASAEKGRALVERCVDRIAAYMDRAFAQTPEGEGGTL